MTIERAIEILDPEHREHYESIEPVNEACRMGIEALKRQKELAKEIFIKLVDSQDTIHYDRITEQYLCIKFEHFVEIAKQYGVCIKKEDEYGI